MSQTIKRALRRQQAAQESYGTAWVLFLVMLPIIFFSVGSLIVWAGAGTLLSFNALISSIIAISAVWVAGHLFREARRLGRLLKNPEQIMQLDRDPDVITGLHWAGLNPFSHWRN